MTESLAPLQLVILVGLILIAALVIRLAFRASRPGADPIIKASARELREGLYQVGLTVINRAPCSLVGVSLRRVRPTSARLMAPITSVRTREGDFQVWSDPVVDSRATSIPVDLVVGPYEGQHGVGSPFATADTAVWLFLPKQSELARLTLELVMRADGKRLRRYRFNVTPESGAVPTSR